MITKRRCIHWNSNCRSSFNHCLSSNIQECTTNFHSDGIRAHSASSVTGVLITYSFIFKLYFGNSNYLLNSCLQVIIIHWFPSYLYCCNKKFKHIEHCGALKIIEIDLSIILYKIKLWGILCIRYVVLIYFTYHNSCNDHAWTMVLLQCWQVYRINVSACWITINYYTVNWGCMEQKRRL